MHPTKATIRRLVCTAGLALTALAFAAGASGGSGLSGGKALDCESAHAQACLTDAEYRALSIRSAALNRKAQTFIPGVTDFPSRLGERGERAAEERVAQLSRQGPPIYVRTQERGFDWSSGATGAGAATLLLLGAALAARVGRRSGVAVG